MNVIQILITPPNEETTSKVLGIVQIGCIPEFAEHALRDMALDDYKITIHLDVPAWDGVDDERRERGMAYMQPYIDRYFTRKQFGLFTQTAERIRASTRAAIQMSNNPKGIIIALLPDKQYVESRYYTQDPHLTIAYLGTVTNSLSDIQRKTRFRSVVDIIAKQTYPIKASANGIGIFPAERNVAVVDIIDSHPVQKVRQLVDNGLPADVDNTHGFVPHITIQTHKKAADRPITEYYLTDVLEPVDFMFDKIALWYGEERYEVQLQL